MTLQHAILNLVTWQPWTHRTAGILWINYSKALLRSMNINKSDPPKTCISTEPPDTTATPEVTQISPCHLSTDIYAPLKVKSRETNVVSKLHEHSTPPHPEGDLAMHMMRKENRELA